MSSFQISPQGVVGDKCCRVSWAVGGRVARVYVPGSAGRGGGGERGQITKFSAASERALKRLVSSLNQREVTSGDCRFVTLTYHEDYPSARASHAHLDAVIKRFERQWGPRGLIWKLEPQKRGAPHYHLLILMGSQVTLQDEVEWWAKNWCEVIGEDVPSKCYRWHKGQAKNRLGEQNRPCVEVVRDWSGVATYAAKYLGKRCENGADWQAPGRFWGVRRRELLPIQVCGVDVSHAVAMKVRRTLVRFIRSQLTGWVTCRNTDAQGRPRGKRIRLKATDRDYQTGQLLTGHFGSVKPEKRRWRNSRGGATVYLSDESLLRILENAWDAVGSTNVYTLPTP